MEKQRASGGGDSGGRGASPGGSGRDEHHDASVSSESGSRSRSDAGRSRRGKRRITAEQFREVVEGMGGWQEVTDFQEWFLVAQDLGLPPSAAAKLQQAYLKLDRPKAAPKKKAAPVKTAEPAPNLSPRTSLDDYLLGDIPRKPSSAAVDNTASNSGPEARASDDDEDSTAARYADLPPVGQDSSDDLHNGKDDLQQSVATTPKTSGAAAGSDYVHIDWMCDVCDREVAAKEASDGRGRVLTLCESCFASCTDDDGVVGAEHLGGKGGLRATSNSSSTGTRRKSVPLVAISTTHTVDSLGQNALHHACESGDMAAVHKIMKRDEAKQLLRLPDANGWTPLLIAAYNGHIRLCTYLLRRHAPATCHSEGGSSPLHYLARFVPGGGGEAASGDGDGNAVDGHDVEAYARLLEKLASKGASVAPNAKGETPLHVAAGIGNVVAAYVLLEETGVELSAETHTYGLQAIHMAARSNSLALMKMLVSYGADVWAIAHSDIDDRVEVTPMSIARESGHTEVVDYLHELQTKMTELGGVPVEVQERQKRNSSQLSKSERWLPRSLTRAKSVPAFILQAQMENIKQRRASGE